MKLSPESKYKLKKYFEGSKYFVGCWLLTVGVDELSKILTILEGLPELKKYSWVFNAIFFLIVILRKKPSKADIRRELK